MKISCGSRHEHKNPYKVVHDKLLKSKSKFDIFSSVRSLLGRLFTMVLYVT